MVDMVVADVAGEPLQDLRQLVTRAALQRCRRVIPVFVGRPVHVLELMLHVEQPDTGTGTDRGHHQLQQQIFDNAERSEEGQAGTVVVITCGLRWGTCAYKTKCGYTADGGPNYADRHGDRWSSRV